MLVAIIGLAVGLGVALAAGVAAYLVNTRIPASTRQDYRDGSGVITGIVGTLFAISVGLVVVAAWGQVNSATQNTSTEASNLIDVFWYSRTLPAEDKEMVQGLATSYATSVIGEEWPLMADQRRMSDASWNAIEQLRAHFQTIQPGSGGASARYGQAMTRMQAVLEARRTRAQMVDTGVPPLLWLALGGCGLIVMLPAVLCGSPVRRVHVTMAAIVGGLVGIVLFLVYQLDFPFSGGVAISAEAFEQALQRFGRISALP